MNPLGVHALVFGAWSEGESERSIDSAASLGFEVIEIPLLEPARIDARRIARRLERAGIQPVTSLGLEAGSDISSGDPELVARGEAHLNLALSVARDLGSPLLTGVLFSALGKYPQPPSEAGRWNCVRVLAALAERAAKSDMRLGLEAVNRYESNLVNTAAQALALIDDIGADNVVVHLDSYHMNIEEGDPASAVERCGERLGYVHAGESHRGYLGSGTVDFGALFTALARTGYDGVITFEAFTAGIGDGDLNAALAIWREVWADSQDLAHHARQFMVAECGAAQHRLG
jgi:D-psicose/D-tagatose/L-ribulose 3-epimerase